MPRACPVCGGDIVREQGDDAAHVPPDGLEAIPAHVSGRPAAVLWEPCGQVA